MMSFKTCAALCGIVAACMACVWVGPGIAQPHAGTRADLVLTGGNVYTMSEEQPRAEAVAVGGGRILYVGTNAGALALARRD
ncbi:MAG: amidohydrolase, partial [bacterium]